MLCTALKRFCLRLQFILARNSNLCFCWKLPSHFIEPRRCGSRPKWMRVSFWRDEIWLDGKRTWNPLQVHFLAIQIFKQNEKKRDFVRLHLLLYNMLLLCLNGANYQRDTGYFCLRFVCNNYKMGCGQVEHQRWVCVLSWLARRIAVCCSRRTVPFDTWSPLLRLPHVARLIHINFHAFFFHYPRNIFCSFHQKK